MDVQCRSTTSTTSTTTMCERVNNTEQESAGFRSVVVVVVPAPLDQIDPAEAGLHREPAEEI